jgi:hypothetical protein
VQGAATLKTTLEALFIRLVDGAALYTRQSKDVTAEAVDPNRLVEEMIESSLGISREEMKRLVISHSTSWRHEPPDSIVLTYLVYSDHFHLGQAPSLLELGEVTRALRGNNGSTDEETVVAHALRHMAFLLRTDETFTADKELDPETGRHLAAIWGDASGRI